MKDDWKIVTVYGVAVSILSILFIIAVYNLKKQSHNGKEISSIHSQR